MNKVDIEKLANKLRKASDAYYNLGTKQYPKLLMKDADFDKGVELLRKHAPKHKFLKQVRAPVNNHREKHKLPVVLGSLAKGRPENIDKWVQSTPKAAEFWLVPKFDGQTILLHYRNGDFKNAYTGGEGNYGRKVTEHVKHLQGVPSKIEEIVSKGRRKKTLFSVKGDLYFVGEAVLHKSLFTKHFSDAGYSTCRNTVVGMINRATPKPEYLKYMTFITFRVVGKFETKHQELLAASLWKFTTALNPSRHKNKEIKKLFNVTNSKKLAALLPNHDYKQIIEGHYISSRANITAEYLKDRLEVWSKQLDVDLDGLVLQVFQTKLADKMKFEADGMTPASARAIKLAPEEQFSQVGKVGSIHWGYTFRRLFKPVIILADPLNFKGAKITNISVANALAVKENGLGKGAKVRIVRSGDVIPWMSGVVKASKPEMPTKCVYCKSKLEWTDVDLYCPNSECKGLPLLQLHHFFSVIKVDGLAGGVIEQLVDAGYDSLPKLLTVDSSKLAKLDRWGDTKAKKIAKGLQSCLKNVPLPKLMKASGMFADQTSGLGETILTAIVDHLGKKKVLNSRIKEQHISNIADVGPDRRKLFLTGIEPFRRLYQQITAVSEVKLQGKAKLQSTSMAGIIACFTGFRDGGLESQITLNGGIVKTSFTKDVNLVFAKDMSTGKAAKAVAQGIKIIPAAKAAAWISKQLKG